MSTEIKVNSYSVCPPVRGATKQWAIWIDYNENRSTPLVYLQRPKYITDDALWVKIVQSIKLNITAEELQGL